MLNEKTCLSTRIDVPIISCEKGMLCLSQQQYDFDYEDAELPRGKIHELSSATFGRLLGSYAYPSQHKQTRNA
jgi:hypothetical protein